MSTSQVLSNMEVEAVGLSWTQNNRSDFLFDSAPIVRANGEFSGVGNSTYKIPALDNFMLATHLDRWSPGQADSKQRVLTSTSLVVAPTGRQTDLIVRPARRPRNHAFRDLETNLVPGLLGMTYQGVDVELVDFLTNTTNFGTAKTFTATGDPTGYLANTADHGNQGPLNDLRSEIDAIRKFRRREMPIEMWTTRQVLEILAHHPDIHGGGVGSAAPSARTFADTVAILTDLLGLDAIRISNAVSDTLKKGKGDGALSTSLDEIARNLLWVGIVDRRNRVFDIRNVNQTFDSPDGAICIATELDPYVKQSRDDDGEVDKYRGRCSIQIYSPRGSKMGFFFKATGGSGSISA